VLPLVVELGNADRLAAARIETATPPRLLRHVARLRIAELHELVRHDAKDSLSVVKVALDERDDVIDRLWRLVRVRFDLERALHRLDDKHRSGPWRLRRIRWG